MPSCKRVLPYLGIAALAAALLAQAAAVARLQAPKQIAVRAHATATAVVAISIQPGFHIQSNHPKLDYLIASTISLTPAGGVSLLRADWPRAQNHKFSFSPDPLTVFEGNLRVPLVLKTGATGHYTLHGSFRYQACNDQLCRPPVSQPFILNVAVR